MQDAGVIKIHEHIMMMPTFTSETLIPVACTKIRDKLFVEESCSFSYLIEMLRITFNMFTDVDKIYCLSDVRQIKSYLLCDIQSSEKFSDVLIRQLPRKTSRPNHAITIYLFVFWAEVKNEGYHENIETWIK